MYHYTYTRSTRIAFVAITSGAARARRFVVVVIIIIIMIVVMIKCESGAADESNVSVSFVDAASPQNNINGATPRAVQINGGNRVTRVSSAPLVMKRLDPFSL